MDTNEGIFTREQLEILDKEIDALISSFELLRISRCAALRTVLTEFDAIVQYLGLDPDLTQRALNYRVAYQSLNHAVRWIFNNCPEKDPFVPENPETLAVPLLDLARDYHYIEAQMSLAFRGRNNISQIAEKRFRVTSAGSENQELETARSLIAAAEFPDTHEEAKDLPTEIADELRSTIKIEGVSGRLLRYKFPNSTYETASSIMDGRRLYKLSMNPDWNLGGYTFRDVQCLWHTLKTLQSLHQLALQKLPLQKDRRRLNLKVLTRSEWVHEISKYSGLKSEVTSRAFEDLIYNPSIHQLGRKKAHVMYQPFVELRPDEIAQSNALVMMTAVEKCSWILTEVLRPEIHERLKNLKERHWIDHEFIPLRSDKLSIFPHIRYTHNDKRRDIDLLMVDTVANFALIAQLKWTTAGDNVAGVESDDKQFAKGVEQAIDAVEWAENNRSELARRIGLERTDLDSTTFRPIVIGRDTLPSGTFVSPNVPVINEALFRWIIKEPHNATLEQLWRIASRNEYLPKEGVHFESNVPPPIVWGPFEFVLEDVSYRPLPQRWDPAFDIVLS